MTPPPKELGKLKPPVASPPQAALGQCATALAKQPWLSSCLGHPALFDGETPDDAVYTKTTPPYLDFDTIEDTVETDHHPKLIPPVIPFGLSGGSSGATVAAPKCPFDIVLSGVGVSSSINVFPGTINSFVPVGLFFATPHNATSSTPKYVIVRATTNGRSVTSATLIVSTSPAVVIACTPNVAPATFDVLIGVVVGAEVSKVWSCGNISAIITQAAVEDSPTPSPGLANVIRWFTWAISVI